MAQGSILRQRLLARAGAPDVGDDTPGQIRMTDDPSQQLVPLARERENVVKVLIDQYSADNLTVEEFESRLDSGLRRVLDHGAIGSDLLHGSAGARHSGTELERGHVRSTVSRAASCERVPESGYQTRHPGRLRDRRGEWTPPRKLYTSLADDGWGRSRFQGGPDAARRHGSARPGDAWVG